MIIAQPEGRARARAGAGAIAIAGDGAFVLATNRT